MLEIILLSLTMGLFIIILFFLISTSKKITKVDLYLSTFDKGQDRLEKILREEVAQNRKEATEASAQSRKELSDSFKLMSEIFMNRINETASHQKSQLETFSTQLLALTKSNEDKMELMRKTIEDKLKSLQEDNSKKLEEMRKTVDEKLHETLEKRLGESFKQVSERLEQVHRGLGEMQTLASGVGDLKKVLTNVKTRGTWGEIQLGNLLEQILAPEQYETNISTKKNSKDRVEFAIKLPEGILLPIDAKFPQEDYQKLIEAQEQANPVLVEELSKQLENRIKTEAKDIRDKYLDPPHTTDFGIMFLPTEGLYAEVIRRPGLFDTLQRDFRVTITGPSTLWAFLTSLQVGFKTLAIQKRSSEVWALLGAVKTEFGRFGDILDKTYKKLQEASNTIDDASKKTRAIERKLKNVEELPVVEAIKLIGLDEAEEESAATS